MIGDLNEVHDIWEIEDANAVGTVMRWRSRTPRSGPLVGGFAEQVEEEVLTVLTKTPYSP